ncbi:hypothetical protein DPEC_G00219340 [Dallia pectoralis]|uniref:Uncharacterized protein n=1 Tax=Dallia pectoralis TaxID=75939 RepID=A0ACC2G3J2_DALPE|nr:hypothetical protein DPEC_G00219340 [Dallia pectoralis]
MFVHNKWDEMWDSRILQKHPNTYIHGCPCCHVAHNNAKAAGVGFVTVSGFDLEDMVVDIGYWFKGRTNQKGYLTGFPSPPIPWARGA